MPNIIPVPTGYVAPGQLKDKTTVTGIATTQQAALNNIQDNLLATGYDAQYIADSVTIVNQNVTQTYNLLNKQQAAFTSFSTSVATFDAKVGNMEPAIITESISFLLGAFVALAFVLASKMRL